MSTTRDWIRETALGQVARAAGLRRVFPYPEEKAEFVLPEAYNTATSEWQRAQEKLDAAMPQALRRAATASSSSSDRNDDSDPDRTAAPTPAANRSAVGLASEKEAESPDTNNTTTAAATRTNSSVDLDPDVEAGAVADADVIQEHLSRTHSWATRARTNGADEGVALSDGEIRPTVTSSGVVLVDWYTTSDPSNPQNWSLGRKLAVTLVVGLYTFTVYTGSSLYAPSAGSVMEIFHVGDTAASLGLALYVLAYGLGPMLWSPLAEIPRLGRNWIYVATFTCFVFFALGAALVGNFPGLLVLRFLLGFFGSPCLATGGATFGDMWSPYKMPYVLATWAGAATLGPALGPVVAGFADQAMGWRWGQWVLFWVAAPTLLLMVTLLPETSSDNILLRRAQRLRARTGREDLQAASEIAQRSMSASQVAREALVKPWEINAKDPAVLYTTVYTALVYGIYYSFFESFPLVYPVMYNFNLGQTGLPFLGVGVALVLAVIPYVAYFYFIAEPAMHNDPNMGIPESRLVPGLVGSFLIPIGLFIFAWTANPNIHWIASVVGLTLSIIGTYLVIQVIFMYLPFTYPKYAASLFAANDLARSSFAFASILFARPMFLALGVSGGVSLLGGLTILCIGGIFIMYFFGASLRARSSFATTA